jgi:glycosyltransferase involved in cell wall biosynthesis
VANAIESALAQTYSLVEVVVVNDGSTDGSADAIAPYRDRITYVETANHGAGHARNVGLEKATGTYVKFLDADDTLFSDAVKEQVQQAVASDRENSIVFGDAHYVQTDGSLRRKTSFGPPAENENRLLYILRRNVQTSLPLHRRHLLEAVDGFDEGLPRAQEYDLHFRLATQGGATFQYHAQPITRILVHEDAERISNQDHFPDDPTGRLKRIRKRAVQAKEVGLLDDPLRRFLAQDAWHAGRMALRHGVPSIGGEYFQLARSLHDDHMASSSAVYRGLVRLTNPRIAERFAEWLRRARESFDGIKKAFHERLYRPC